MKRYNETRFEINRNIIAKCWSEDTRYGFRHLAELDYKYENIENTKACYYNRTWECYTFESVLKSLYSKAKENESLSVGQLRAFNKLIQNGGKKEAKRVKDQFKSVAMVASMGSLFSDTKKQANSWKARMIQAGIPQLSLPSDWDTLSESEKETRLDKVIAELGN